MRMECSRLVGCIQNMKMGEKNNKKQKLETFFYKRKKGQRLKIDRLAAARN